MMEVPVGAEKPVSPEQALDNMARCKKLFTVARFFRELASDDKAECSHVNHEMSRAMIDGEESHRQHAPLEVGLD